MNIVKRERSCFLGFLKFIFVEDVNKNLDGGDKFSGVAVYGVPSRKLNVWGGSCVGSNRENPP